VDVDRAARGRPPALTVEASIQVQDDAGGPRPQILCFGASLTKVCAHGTVDQWMGHKPGSPMPFEESRWYGQS
jgi:hypothetical protein